MRRLQAVLLTVVAGSALTAQSPPAVTPTPAAGNDPNSKLVNIPGTPWQVYGEGQTNKYADKAGPAGYPLTQVKVTRVGKNPWDIGANNALTKPVVKGDLIFAAVYLRAPNLAEGATVTLPVAVTGATAPYDGIASGSAQVGMEWKQVYAVGKAPHDFAAGAAQAAVHLAGAKQVVDLGPVRVFDFGPDADPARLPHN